MDNEKCGEVFSGSRVESYSLRQENSQSGKFIIDPQYTGESRFSQHGTSFVFEHRKEVLMKAEISNPKGYAIIKLVDSSVPGYVQRDALMIIIFVITPLLAVIIVAITTLLRITRRATR